jgi:hypothetical protein
MPVLPSRAAMDPGPFFAAVALVGVLGVTVLAPLARAFAERLRGKSRDAALDNGEVDALRDELHSLRQQVSELAERQDFAERLLAQAREKGLLSAPKEPTDK